MDSPDPLKQTTTETSGSIPVPKPAAPTQEEEAQLTMLGCVAFDYIRREALKDNVAPCCWLCTSKEMQQEAIQKVVEELKQLYGDNLTPKVLETLLPLVEPLKPLFEQWRNAELIYKQYRQDGNPWAFFVKE